MTQTEGYLEETKKSSPLSLMYSDIDVMGELRSDGHCHHIVMSGSIRPFWQTHNVSGRVYGPRPGADIVDTEIPGCPRVGLGMVALCMVVCPKVQQCPDVSAEERAAHEFVKRILKLRWIGKQVEAERMLLSALREVGPKDLWGIRHQQPRLSAAVSLETSGLTVGYSINWENTWRMT